MTGPRRRGSSRIGTIRAPALLLAGLLAFPASVAGQGFEREVAFLTIPTGARVVGLGRAAVALRGELQSVRWNPAVLASMDRVHPLLSHYDGPLDFRVDYFAVAVPAGGLGVLALSVNLQSFGEIPLFAPESPDIQTGVVSPNNLVAALSFARELTAGLSVGLSGKWIRSELIGRLSGDTYALDAGLLFRPAEGLPLDLGLGMLNVGPGLRVGEDSGPGDPLPGRLRVGATYDVMSHLRPEAGLRLMLAVELEHALRRMATGSQYVGTELGVGEVLFIRGGYIAETLIETNTGYTLGAGLAVGPIRFDLGRELGVNQVGDETHVSLSARL